MDDSVRAVAGQGCGKSVEPFKPLHLTSHAVAVNVMGSAGLVSMSLLILLNTVWSFFLVSAPAPNLFTDLSDALFIFIPET